MIFQELKKDLSTTLGRKATWEEVAKHYEIPFLKGKGSKEISRKVSGWSKKGIPPKIKLWFIENEIQ